jgi:hypothetical protein
MSADVNTIALPDGDYDTYWKKPANRIGVITIIIAIAVSFLPNIYLYVAHGVMPDINQMMTCWGMIAVAYAAFYFVEPFSYYPILGLTGTYMSFLSGNISNLRVPASSAAQNAVGVEWGTEKAGVVSTLAISGSVITNTIFVTIAALAGTMLISLLPEGVVSALTSFTLPAVFGGVFASTFDANWKLGLISLPVPIILIGVCKFPGNLIWIVIIASVFVPILLGRLMYKKGII